MRKKFLNITMDSIKKKYPKYDNDKLEVIAYGLESLYIMFTKTIVISSLALLVGVFKEMLIILVLYNIIRTTAFGMHARESWQCYVISITLFIGGALLFKYIDINFYVKFAIGAISYIFLVIYAPADTYKRPLVNAKKRKIYKIITMINSSIYLVLIFILRESNISTALSLGLLDSMLMIHPLTYRMFHLPYNNYKTYNESYN